MPAPVELVGRFRRLRALVIGDAMLDSYLEGNASRLCTEGPVPVIRRTSEERVPGGAANTAANLRALGAQVTFIGVLGKDVPGMLLEEALRDRDVDTRFLIRDESVGTVHKLRILADDQYVVRYDSGETSHYPDAVKEALLALVEELFHQTDIVVLSDYGYGVFFDELIERLRTLQVREPRILVVDSKDLSRFSSLPATALTPNHLEAQAVVGRVSDVRNEVLPEELRHVALRLLAGSQAQHVALTMGADGVILADRVGESIHHKAHAVPHPNDVGAGDSFAAALALALGAGADPSEAVKIGISAGTIAVAQRRTSVVLHQELLQRVSLEGHVPSGSIEHLLSSLDEERLAGRTIVFTNGVFDILHAGHIHFLREAKGLGDILVVGVNSDGSAKQLKGKNRPINSERDRLALVSALDSVDHVLLFDEATPANLIRTLKPDVHVKGGDYEGTELPEAAAVADVGGRVEILPLVGSLSTTRVIDRILELALAETTGTAR